MTFFDRRWLLIALMLAVTALPIRVRAQTTTPTVVFSEIAWAGSSLSSSDEWIELANLTNEPIDLSGWIIEGSATGGTSITLPANSSIAPSSTFIIANYENAHANSSLAVAANFVSAALSLPNDGFQLRLLNAALSQIDVAGGDGRPFAGRSGGAAGSVDGRYVSMVRMEPIIDGSLREAWIDAQLTTGLKNGIMDLATPGMSGLSVVSVPEPIPEPLPTVTIPEVPPTIADPIISFAGTIVINEFVSDPSEGGTEWIELFNQSSSAVSLVGWRVEDAALKATLLPDVELAAGSFFVVDTPLGKLNNDGDTIRLLDPVGVLIDEVAYGTETLPTPQDGASLARDATNAFIVSTSPTMGAANVFTQVTEPTLMPEEPAAPEPTTLPTPASEPVAATVPSAASPAAAKALAGEREAASAPSPAPAVLPLPTPTTLRFTALYPNTDGSDQEEEYIRVENFGNENVELLNWDIQDASGKTYRFDQADQLGTSAIMTLMRPQTNIALNNAGDTLHLISPSGDVIDSVAYVNAPKGGRYEYANGQWSWSSTSSAASSSAVPPSSPSSPSVPSSPPSSPAPAPSPTSLASTPSTPKPSRAVSYPSRTIVQTKTMTDKSRAQIEGAVTAIPGAFGRQVMYVSDETGGVQVYFYDGAFPELALGDVVRVRGELTTSRGEQRLKVAQASDIVVLGQTEVQEALSIEIAGAMQDRVGELLSVTGMVQSIDDTKLTLEENGATLVVNLKSTPPIDANRFQRGDEIRVTGVLTRYDDALRLRPRTDADIIVVTPASVEAPVVGGIARGDSQQGKIGTILLIVTVAALAALAVVTRRRRVALATP